MLIDTITKSLRKYGNIQNSFMVIRKNSSLAPITRILKPVKLKPDNLSISCTILDKNGKVKAISKKFPKTQFLQQNKLFPRDLRKIDSSNVDVAPVIAVRTNCILINLLFIKALIKSDSIMIFDTSNSDSQSKLSLFMYDLESKLKTKVVHGNGQFNLLNQSYEFRALECILVNVMAILESELKNNLSIIETILNQLDSLIDRSKLKELLVHSKKLTTFYQKSLLIKNTLDELLDNDEDLENMYLTENMKLKKMICDDDIDDHPGTSSAKHATTSATAASATSSTNATNANSTASINSNSSNNNNNISNNSNNNNANHFVKDEHSNFDTGEVEMLLEAYYKQCDEIVQQAETMINDIKSTEEIVNIILDANRNSLMVFELRIAIFTLGFTVATVIPAFYGMNLKNFIETSEIAFPVVVGISMFLGLSLIIVSLRKLSDVKKMTMVSSKQLNKFDENIKNKLLEKLRLQRDKDSCLSDSKRKQKQDIIWKWLVDDKK